MRDSAVKVQTLLDQNGIEANVIEFNELTRTSEEAARAIGCQVAQIAKTLIFRTKKTHRPVCVIASGINRVNEKRIGEIVGEKIERADADFVLAHTGFAIGGIPPIDYAFEIPTIIDEDLFQFDEVWAAAGTPHAVFRLSPEALVRLSKGACKCILVPSGGP